MKKKTKQKGKYHKYLTGIKIDLRKHHQADLSHEKKTLELKNT